MKCPGCHDTRKCPSCHGAGDLGSNGSTAGSALGSGSTSQACSTCSGTGICPLCAVPTKGSLPPSRGP
jgi:hypothetical protein